MLKKTAILIVSIILMVSCGVRKQSVSPIAKTDGAQSEIIDYGMKHLNKPYRYAGKGPSSFDCSGFTSFVFKEFGYRLSTSSSGQAKQVPSINRKEDLRVGDLVFFEGRAHNGRVGHVGIVKEVLPNGNFLFLHASTSYGVIVSRSTEPYYASRYLHGGRVLKENNQIILANNKTNTKKEATAVAELRSAKKAQSEMKEPAVVKAPKTQTEQELDLTRGEEIYNSSIKSDSIIIHTRSITFPASGQPSKSKEEKEKEVTISKSGNRGSNRGVPKPKQKPNSPNNPQIHKVLPGDTLYSISRRYSCSVDKLRDWNPKLGETLKAGETINIYY